MSVDKNDDASLIALEVLLKIRYSPSTVVHVDGINGRAIVSPLKGAKNYPASVASPEPVGASLVTPHFVPKSIQPREKTHKQVKSAAGHSQSTHNAARMNEPRREFAANTSCEPMIASFSVVPVKSNPVFVSRENLQPKALENASTLLRYEQPQIAPCPETIQRYDTFSMSPEMPASAAVAMIQASYPKRSTAQSLANNALHMKSGPSQPISKKILADVSNEIGEAVNIQIRKEEVNAALHSRPQRGRKRENLSALERMELTRSRNREHAKSTRVRKKARYQELLDIEQKFKEMEKRDELNSKRLACLQTLCSIRSNIISNALRRKLSYSDEASDDPSRFFLKESNATPQESDASTSKTKSDDKENRQSRTVSFVDFVTRVSPCSRNSETKTSDVDELLDILHWSKGEQRAQNELAVNHTQDGNILEHVLATYNITSESSLSYRLTDSDDGIAHTSGDVTYVEYEVALKQGGSTRNDTVIFNGFLKVRFNEKSRNILALQYSLMSPAFEASDASLSRDLSYSSTAQGVMASPLSSLGSLRYQKSFPSMVSLENNHVVSGNKDVA
eukprot:CAMPEP_0198305856 /NCGR_PEP_ID=MMETSP1449-20131203/58122_1 /TAXON_ID=420275 /ORGANISM="Attheya septentrionalis, Strain CCMP2084" /LENGTH=563 /DNA_ID=CAMNT_0044008399 /DNA_START=58 /DNA_END=1749 /DNA_ORIENTATION=+